MKFLPLEMLHEARSAAPLDNPYICSIHEVGEFDGRDFVEGQTLMEKLRRGRLPLNQVLRLAWK
jgi:hypothetical protein